MAKPANVHGLVVVDKPPGMTSHDVVARCRRVFRQRQVGHAGTLDPDATGVLLIGLGNATRLLRYLSESRKSYRGTITFGSSTDTLDAAGIVTGTCTMNVERSRLELAVAEFEGPIQQIPPMVSAIKIDGKRLHELARDGIEVERKPRPVTIHRIEVESVVLDAHPQAATVLVECSSGTYIRTLAADIGTALGGLAHLATLRRLSVGAFMIGEATPLATIMAAEAPNEFVLSPAAMLRSMPVVTPNAEQLAKIANGATFSAAEFLPAALGEHEGPFAVHDASAQLVAVYERRAATLGVKPALVIPRSDRPS